MLDKTRRLARRLSAMLRSRSRYWANLLLDCPVPVSKLSLGNRGGALWIGNIDVALQRGNHDFMVAGLDLAIRLRSDAGAIFSVDSDGNLVVQLSGLKVYVQTWEELFILSEIHIEGVYNFSMKSDPFVLDIGMNVGMTSLFIAAKFPNAEIIGFEPVRPTFEQAQRNISLNPELARRVTVCNYGLGREDGSHQIEYLKEFRGSIGLHNLQDRYRDRGEIMTEIITVRDAAAAVEQFISKNAGRPVVLKIDCEGAEYDILNRLVTSGEIGRIDAIMMECHKRNPLQEPAGLVELLSDRGFHVIHLNPHSSDISMLYATRIQNVESRNRVVMIGSPVPSIATYTSSQV